MSDNWHKPQMVREGNHGEYVFVEWLREDWAHKIRIECCDESSAQELMEALDIYAMNVAVVEHDQIVKEIGL